MFPIYPILFLIVTCYLKQLQCQLDSASDISWNFASDTTLQGWANENAASMQVTVSLLSGELQVFLYMSPFYIPIFIPLQQSIV